MAVGFFAAGKVPRLLCRVLLRREVGAIVAGRACVHPRTRARARARDPPGSWPARPPQLAARAGARGSSRAPEEPARLAARADQVTL